jgi:hypothetical protein
MRHTLLPALLILCAVSGCTTLLTGTANTDDALKIMQAQQVRGCLYLRVNASPYAQASMLLVGTWGTDPPAYSECWQGLPTGLP